MTDIHQWRRMIQSKHARTSTPAHDQEERGSHSDAPSNPDVQHTPRRKSRPRFSTYLSNYLSAAGSKPEPFSIDHFPHSRVSEDVDTHNTECAIDSIYSTLLTEPFKPLPLPLNGAVLRVLEAYRGLVSERSHLRARLAEELQHQHAATEAFREAEGKWTEEERSYKAEIRRLELLAARTRNGVADVVKARQSSVLARNREDSVVSPEMSGGRETVYEFLERSRRDEDVMRRSQRVLLHQSSPSKLMSRLSHKFSTISFHEDLPFGSPPATRVPHSLAGVSSEGDARKDVSLNSRGLSEDCHSAFSSSGDPLPDEIDNSSVTLTAATDEDFQTIRQMAAVLARRHALPVDQVIPQLISMVFDPQSNGFTIPVPSTDPLTAADTQPLSPNTASPGQPNLSLDNRLDATTTISKRPSAPANAKKRPARPQSSTDADISTMRRPFSFCAGDDEGLDTPRGRDAEPARRADSLSALTVRSSPTLSQPPPTPLLWPSKIPSPVHEPPAARPRPRQNSSSSSRKSSVTALRDDSGSSRAPSSRGSWNAGVGARGLRLVDQRRCLRNGGRGGEGGEGG